MLEPINIELGSWDWKTQTLGEGDNAIQISRIISRIERGFYKTKKVELNIETFNLSDYGFACDNLFDFLVHYKLTENADLKYPIILNNEGCILDGKHRLCKAILQGKKTIKGIMILDSKVI